MDGDLNQKLMASLRVVSPLNSNSYYGSSAIVKVFPHFKLENQLMVKLWFGARWFGYLGSPSERDCYLGAPLESQTTNSPLVDENLRSNKLLMTYSSHDS